MPDDDKIYSYGIDGLTGEYLVPPLSYDEVASFVKGESHSEPKFQLFTYIKNKLSQINLGLVEGLAEDDVGQAGWGIVFHVDEDPLVKDALVPLIMQRCKQIGDCNKVKILEYDGEMAADDWLAEHGVAAGTVKPWLVPYYLLIVGSPDKIPFAFGSMLDVEYAVGRLYFEKVSQYKQYANSVIAYESGEAQPRRKEVAFFGTRHKYDKATQLSADLLLNSLAVGLPAHNSDPGRPAVAEHHGFQTCKIPPEEATKDRLGAIFAPETDVTPPAFLFTATHGVGFRKPLPSFKEQVAKSGALVCQDWTGSGPFEKEHYFAAQDLPANSRVHGLINFHFACYGAGTPEHDQYMHKPGELGPQISEKPFLAALPQALLSHSQGGALACIGHVERVWSYSFTTAEAGTLTQPFYNTIARILDGKPVGFAVKDFNERFASLSVNQAALLKDINQGVAVPDKKLAANWAWRSDAEGYLIVGDPAVQLRVDELD